jgi:outer membrane receptor for ferrienterochelin and colicins
MLALSFLVFCTQSGVLSQSFSGTIVGTVTTEQGTPLISANVIIQGTTVGTATSNTGRFRLSNVPPGKQVLVISFVGYRTLTKEIEVRAGEVHTLDIVLSEETITFSPIVVTATRTEKNLADVPIRTSVIPQRDIMFCGGSDLRAVLAEQTGLALIQDHGTGVQLQGLDPAYTLILIDGEPLIGRRAGTLELSRVSVGNIERIEIVKGPSSSLYGSEALAGVINIITAVPRRPWSGSLEGRAARYHTYELSGTVEHTDRWFSGSIFVNRKSSSGYDLTPATISPTVAPYTDYTIIPKMNFTIDEQTAASVSARWYHSEQKSQTSILQDNQPVLFNERSTLTDWNIAPSISHRFLNNVETTLKLFATRYRTQNQLEYDAGGGIYSRSLFDQAYYKAETQTDFPIANQWLLSLGAGAIIEGVEADRIQDGKRTTESTIAYAQVEWIPTPMFDFIVSARYDAHRDYAAQVSPKAAALVKPFTWLTLRASVGSGFKAPTFQQLYLDFTNPGVGYSVFGSVGVKELVAKLQEQGQIQMLLIDPQTLETIRPEHAISYNAGLEITLPFNSFASFNIFRNNVRDLIETNPVALKTNGQSVYTYFNLNKIFTQGIEAEVTVRGISGLSFTLGYQYLEAKDEEALERIRAGKIVKVGSNGRIRPVHEAEYGGLFHRSAHSGVVRLAYEHPATGTALSLRGVLRGKYGFADRNLNGVLDDDSEYAPGYALWNASVIQTVTDFISLQVGVENLLNKRDPQRLSSVPGRILFAIARINVSSSSE